MAPRLNLFTARNVLRQPYRSLVASSRQNSAQSPINWSAGRTTLATDNLIVQNSRRLYSSKSDKDIPKDVEQPIQNDIPPVSEEAAAIDKILSGKKCDGSAPGSPELEQGTPIDEVG
jgi:hypothetical protein